MQNHTHSASVFMPGIFFSYFTHSAATATFVTHQKL